ncbi:MAG: LysE family translocator [Pseudomonadales bacterium]|nr:LysE family translocator [Pseudomonadales bacterium]
MELLLPLMSFVIVSTITPGPNNLLLAASGMNFGFRATVPHLLGIHLGIYTMSLMCAFGLNQWLLAFPGAELALKLFGSAYLLWLAWKLIGLEMTAGGDEHARPMTWWQAAIFQFSNPKAWMMVTTGIGLALPASSSGFEAGLWLIAGFGTLGMICNCIWVQLGKALQQSHQIPARRRWINGVLVLMVLATVLLFWLG